jgi:hypothetical protein
MVAVDALCYEGEGSKLDDMNFVKLHAMQIEMFIEIRKRES